MRHDTPTGTRRHFDSGYVLIEGLVALMVVAAGILGVAKLQSAIVTASADAKATAMAYSVGRAKLEELRTTTQKSQHTGTSCTAGSVVKTGSDTVSVTGMETTYNRSWTVTPLNNQDGSCEAARHRVDVTVSWSTREASKNIVLGSVVAWNDPLGTSASTGTGGTGGGGVGALRPASAKFVPDDYAFVEKKTVRPAGSDKAKIVLSTAGEYILLVDGKAKIASSVPFVRLSGLVGMDGKPDGTNNLLNIAVYRTDITYCIFPLSFDNQNNPEEYGKGTGTTTTHSAAAYVCYVPEGWRGSIGLLRKCGTEYDIFDNNGKKCSFDGYLACPGGQEGNAFISGVRNIKTLVRDENGNIIGSSGVLPSHETIEMPDYGPLKQTWRLDFAIIPSSKEDSFCLKKFGSVGSGITGSSPSTWSIIRRQGEWTGSSGKEGVPSIWYTQHVLANEASLLREITGSATGCTKVSATGEYPYPGTVECPINGGSYSCKLRIGWTGSVTATPNGDPAQRNITNLTVSVSDQDFTCTASP